MVLPLTNCLPACHRLSLVLGLLFGPVGAHSQLHWAASGSSSKAKGWPKLAGQNSTPNSPNRRPTRFCRPTSACRLAKRLRPNELVSTRLLLAGRLQAGQVSAATSSARTSSSARTIARSPAARALLRPHPPTHQLPSSRAPSSEKQCGPPETC